MIVFRDVMERIEAILATEKQSRHIYNKEIAKALALSPEYYAVIKKRGKVPYEAIALFCKKREISINWILLGQEPQKLCQKVSA